MPLPIPPPSGLPIAGALENPSFWWNALLATVALAAVVLVGRVVLHVAWKLLLVVGTVSGAVYALAVATP